MAEEKGKELKIVLDYPQDIGHPKYCNFVNVRFTNLEYTFDFAYVDPKQLQDDIPDDIVKASVVQRVCMSHQVAKSFLDAFKGNLKKFEKVSEAK